MVSEIKKTARKKAELHDVITPLLNSMFNEFKDLSKKKPDGAVSKGKINIVNRLLSKCKAILKDELSYEFLDLLNEDDVPQYSDIVLVLSQWEAAMEQFHDTYYGYNRDYGEHRWFIE